MLIPIKRIYLTSGIEVEILINTNYIIKISPTDPKEFEKPVTRILLCSNVSSDPDIMYTNESISTIKGKLTKARNKKQEEE